MKKLIVIFLVLLVAVAIGVVAHTNPGYVFITLGHMHLQTTLWFAILALVVGLWVIYGLLRLVLGLYRIPTHMRHFTQHRREVKLQKLTHQALCALFEGYWEKCEKYFTQSAKKGSHAFFHYLGAAEAAFEQKKYTNCDAYLKKAQQIATPDETLALEITRARWQLAAGEYQSALRTFLLLQKVSPNHVFVLNGLTTIYLALENWQALCELLPKLHRYAQLETTAYDQLEHRVYMALLHQAGKLNDLPVLEKTWRSIPERWHKAPEFLAVYADYLIKQDQHAAAEAVLKVALRKQRDPVLLEQYAALVTADSAKQLSRAELWLQRDDQNPDLLFCLGRLCFRLRLWGKAKTYLEASLKYKPRVDIYPVLGQVLEQLGEKSAALDCYKAGLNFVIQ